MCQMLSHSLETLSCHDFSVYTLLLAKAVDCWEAAHMLLSFAYQEDLDSWHGHFSLRLLDRTLE
jgi:hypothetical protein